MNTTATAIKTAWRATASSRRCRRTGFGIGRGTISETRTASGAGAVIVAT
jgi:hypothetical protein